MQFFASLPEPATSNFLWCVAASRTVMGIQHSGGACCRSLPLCMNTPRPTICGVDTESVLLLA